MSLSFCFAGAECERATRLGRFASVCVCVCLTWLNWVCPRVSLCPTLGWSLCPMKGGSHRKETTVTWDVFFFLCPFTAVLRQSPAFNLFTIKRSTPKEMWVIFSGQKKVVEAAVTCAHSEWTPSVYLEHFLFGSVAYWQSCCWLNHLWSSFAFFKFQMWLHLCLCGSCLAPVQVMLSLRM